MNNAYQEEAGRALRPKQLVSREEWERAVRGVPAPGKAAAKPWEQQHIPVLEVLWRHANAAGGGDSEVDVLRWICLQMQERIDAQHKQLVDLTMRTPATFLVDGIPLTPIIRKGAVEDP